ncbi:MAG TPA: VacJ family lipoprotein [Burkholderiales bacterium]|nr:VacJ family lipoprotein [Burkholderiales bacterium]
MKSLVAVLALLVGGCATTNGDPRDPLEGLNRGVYGFNDKVDTWVMRPVATGYTKFVPGEIRDRVRNFFGNVADPMIGVNNILQGKFEEGFFDWVRFGFNSTLGLFGLHDVASDMGYEKHNEDFGQTFGRWGAGTGPYLVLPFLGSSNVRDGIGLGLDYYLDPMSGVGDKEFRYGLWGVRIVQARSDLLDASRILEEASLDKYTFQRDAYLQRRRSLIYDGQPPREQDPESR